MCVSVYNYALDMYLTTGSVGIALWLLFSVLIMTYLITYEEGFGFDDGVSSYSLRSMLSHDDVFASFLILMVEDIDLSAQQGLRL